MKKILPRRTNPNGTNDVFRADRPVNGRPIAPRVRDKWKDSQLYNVRGRADLRILVNPWGNVGYTVEGPLKYHKTLLVPNVTMPASRIAPNTVYRGSC